MPSFPFFRQFDAMDCGPACLRMIAKFYGKNFTLQTLRERSYLSREGVSMLGISDAAESIGIRTKGVRISFEQLKSEAPLPCIVHWKQKHFVVIYKIRENRIFVSDPAYGRVKYTKKEFLKSWVSTKKEGEEMGLCLLLEPTPDFYKYVDEKSNKGTLNFLFSYLRPYKKFMIQLALGLLLGSLIQLIFPFLQVIS